MYCGKCGSKNLDEAEYCAKCGAKLSATSIPGGQQTGGGTKLGPKRTRFHCDTQKGRQYSKHRYYHLCGRGRYCVWNDVLGWQKC